MREPDVFPPPSPAAVTVGAALNEAVSQIDQRFGEGYAKGHPDLLGAFVVAQVLDTIATCLVAIETAVQR